jgi:hypothetical protein
MNSIVYCLNTTSSRIRVIFLPTPEEHKSTAKPPSRMPRFLIIPLHQYSTSLLFFEPLNQQDVPSAPVTRKPTIRVHESRCIKQTHCQRLEIPLRGASSPPIHIVHKIIPLRIPRLPPPHPRHCVLDPGSFNTSVIIHTLSINFPDKLFLVC